VLKIDQAFVRGLGEDAADTAIVRSVIDLAHALGLVVVAEGVETADQVAHLRRLGCDLAQGYWFARPEPPEEVERLLECWNGVQPRGEEPDHVRDHRMGGLPA
jgi:EAL domain-containing protein (putative c-di-GMP-specific phosphodiesterase class I)